MTRAKRSKTKKKKKRKARRQAKGYRTIRRTQYREAKQAVIKAMEHAYKDRKKKKRNFRKLWITRINAALEALDDKYSSFINQLKENEIELDRKILAQLAYEEPEVFATIHEELNS